MDWKAYFLWEKEKSSWRRFWPLIVTRSLFVFNGGVKGDLRAFFCIFCAGLKMKSNMYKHINQAASENIEIYNIKKKEIFKKKFLFEPTKWAQRKWIL